MKIEIERCIMDPDFALTLEREEMDLVLKLKKKKEYFLTIRLCFSEDEELFFDNTKIESISKSILQGIAIDEHVRIEDLFKK